MIGRTAALALLLSLAPAAAQMPVTAPTPPARTVPVGQGENGDWANVGRYREANAALLAASAGRIVFMGDSITQGWARHKAFGANPAYVGRGIAGQTSQQMLVRFRSDVIALKPAVVHIMAGTNDVAGNTGPETDEEIKGYISNMVELAQGNGIKVVLASIPPAKDFPWRPGLNPTPRIKGLNDWIRSYAAEKGAVYVDYWPALAAPDDSMKVEYSRDGVHPNPMGYAAMQPLATAAIAGALGGN